MQSVKKTALIFSGGNFENIDYITSFSDNAYIICADSGVAFCEKIGFSADLIVGDFDSSLYEKVPALDCSKNAEVIKLNPVKDDTDTEFAVNCALDRGFNKIVLVGGIGSRLDHTLANIFLMEKCSKTGCEMIVLNNNNILHYLSCGTLEVRKSEYRYISVIPLENSVVTNCGFVYPLDGTLMYRDSSRGISNELSGEFGTITVHRGCILVAESKD